MSSYSEVKVTMSHLPTAEGMFSFMVGVCEGEFALFSEMIVTLA